MYEQIKETRSSRQQQLVANHFGLPQVESMCRAITARLEASCGYAGKPWAQRDQKRRYIDSSKAYGSKRMGQSCELKRGYERVITLRPYRENQAGQPPRLQPICDHTLPTELRYEEAGRVIGNLQNNRLHGFKCKSCSTSNFEQTCQVETAKKIKFRCPIGERSFELCSFRERTQIFKMLNLVTLFPKGTKQPLLAYWIVPPRDTYLD
jgi:hypothetical protein